MTKFEIIDSYLKMQWLRPENVVWDSSAALLLNPYLKNDIRMLDLGSGNGYFTFTVSEGSFRDEYDWYFNASPEGFSKNKDIYNISKINDISSYISQKPRFIWKLAIDHKEELLKQANQLFLYENTIVQDANEDIKMNSKFDLIFSNILYWLNDPLGVINKMSNYLNKDGLFIILVPNSNFYNYAESYSWKQKNSKFLEILNRGRSKSIIWKVDYKDFVNDSRILNKFEILDFKTYLSKQVLRIWDFGLRIFSPAFISMVSRLSSEERLRFKLDWCSSVRELIIEQFLEEQKTIGDGKGGFNFIVLKLK